MQGYSVATGEELARGASKVKVKVPSPARWEKEAVDLLLTSAG